MNKPLSSLRLSSPVVRVLGILIPATLLPLSAQAQESSAPVPVPAPAPMEATPAAPEISEAQMLEVFGWMTGMRTGIGQLGLSDEEVASFMAGLDAARRGEELDVDLQTVGPIIAKFIQNKFETRMAEVKAEEEARSASFWEALKADGQATLTASGLGYELLSPGGERKPLATDQVRVHYTGRLLDGKVFDSSVERGEPYETSLGQVIPGWTEGLQLVGEGGKIRLYVPPQLAYGDYGSGDIPPGATLIFDVELISILTPVAEPVPAPVPSAPSTP